MDAKPRVGDVSDRGKANLSKIAHMERAQDLSLEIEIGPDPLRAWGHVLGPGPRR